MATLLRSEMYNLRLRGSGVAISPQETVGIGREAGLEQMETGKRLGQVDHTVCGDGWYTNPGV